MQCPSCPRVKITESDDGIALCQLGRNHRREAPKEGFIMRMCLEEEGLSGTYRSLEQ